MNLNANESDHGIRLSLNVLVRFDYCAVLHKEKTEKNYQLDEIKALEQRDQFSLILSLLNPVNFSSV